MFYIGRFAYIVHATLSLSSLGPVQSTLGSKCSPAESKLSLGTPLVKGLIAQPRCPLAPCQLATISRDKLHPLYMNVARILTTVCQHL